MTNDEIREWLNKQIANLERYRPYESLRFFTDDQAVLIRLRDRLGAADKLAEAVESEVIRAAGWLSFKGTAAALRAYRGEKGGEA